MTYTPEAIPDELKAFPNWVVWRFEERDGRTTKVPYDPKRTWKKAKSNEASTWGAFAEAHAACQRQRFSGIGFQFSGTPFFGVDTDHKQYDGEIHPLAAELLEALGTYTEFSPSKKGQHAIGRGDLPTWAMHRKALAPDLEIELYSEGRFFTITGDLIFHPFIEERQEALESLLKQHGMVKPQTELRKPTTGQVVAFTGSNAQLWERMYASASGPSIRALVNGDLSNHEGDHSRADFALCGHLAFWCNGDAARMDSMFRETALMRPKWNAIHGGEGETYGELTINALLSNWSGEGYNPQKHIERENQTSPASTQNSVKWTDPEVLLRGRAHLSSAHDHGNTINSYARLWLALVTVMTNGLYTTDGQTATLTSEGMTELYAQAGGRPVDRRQQLAYLHTEGMTGQLTRSDPSNYRSAYLLQVPLNPDRLPFWSAQELLQPLKRNQSQLTERSVGRITDQKIAPSPVNTTMRGKIQKKAKLPIWTLYSLAVRQATTAAEIAKQTGLTEQTVKRHLAAHPTLATRRGNTYHATLTPAQTLEFHTQITAPEVNARRERLLTERATFHEDKARFLQQNGILHVAARHYEYAESYRKQLGLVAA